MAGVTLYQMEASPFCDKVRRILAVKGIETRIEEMRFRDLFSRLKKINPAGKVPVIEHRGRFLSDSTDIAYYLERVFPEPALVPADPSEAAQVHMLEDWADESLYFMEMTLRFTLPHNARRLTPLLTAHESPAIAKLLQAMIPKTLRSLAAKQGIGRKSTDALIRDLTRHVEALEGQIGGADWLVGDGLSLADIAVFAQLSCIAQTEEGGSMLRDYPTVQAWMERVDRVSRPAR